MIATKFGIKTDANGQQVVDSRPKHIEQSAEASLKRLKVDAIDLFRKFNIYWWIVSASMQIRRNLPKFDKKAFDLSKWRFHVDGLVTKPLSLKYEDIGRFPNVSLTQDFRCLEGWIVRDIVWQGVRVSSVLELAELNTEATSVLFSSGDYSTVIPVNKALEDSTILALGMRGKVLNSYHGGPVRLVFHGQECYDSVKAVNGIRVLASRVEGTAKGIAMARLAKQS